MDEKQVEVPYFLVYCITGGIRGIFRSFTKALEFRNKHRYPEYYDVYRYFWTGEGRIPYMSETQLLHPDWIEDDLGYVWYYSVPNKKVVLDGDDTEDGGYFVDNFENAREVLIEGGYIDE